MSQWLGFYILPFDWILDPESQYLELPIDMDDFAERIQAECPSGEVEFAKHENSVEVMLYVLTEQNDPWIAARLVTGKPTLLNISAYPKDLAVRLILWYRRYVDLKHPLFMVIADTGEQIELTEHTSAKEVEDHFPKNWKYH